MFKINTYRTEDCKLICSWNWPQATLLRCTLETIFQVRKLLPNKIRYLANWPVSLCKTTQIHKKALGYTSGGRYGKAFILWTHPCWSSFSWKAQLGCYHPKGNSPPRDRHSELCMCFIPRLSKTHGQSRVESLGAGTCVCWRGWARHRVLPLLFSQIHLLTVAEGLHLCAPLVVYSLEKKKETGFCSVAAWGGTESTL